MIRIQPYTPQYQDQVVALILHIQQVEYQVPVTLADQPDLLNIPAVYQSGKGNFWVALETNGELAGTIALLDTGHRFATIRKMFVKAEYRGREWGTASLLYEQLENWAIQQGLESLWLGTYDRLHAALRFYEKKGFSPVEKRQLPEGFPLMAVDNRFFAKNLITE